MTQEHENQKGPAEPNPSGVLRLQFGKDNAFQVELQRRVDEYFRSTGLRKRDCWQMYLKTALVLACFATCYAMLVFVAQTLWQGLLLAVLLGLCTAAIGFDIQHDGGHQAYSERRWVNQADGDDDGHDRRQFLRLALEARRHPPPVREHHGLRHRHRSWHPWPADTPSKAVGVSSMAAPLSLAALRALGRQMALRR